MRRVLRDHQFTLEVTHVQTLLLPADRRHFARHDHRPTLDHLDLHVAAVWELPLVVAIVLDWRLRRPLSRPLLLRIPVRRDGLQ